MADSQIPKMYPETARYLPRSPGSQIDSLDRYSAHWMVGVNKDGIDIRTWETWERPNIPSVADRDVKFYYVKSSEAYRPDIVAQRALGSARLWWWILYSNKLFEPSQMRPGITLMITQPPYDMTSTPRLG